MEKLTEWADELGLSGDERFDFLEAGYLAHAPDELVELYLGLKRRLARLEESASKRSTR